MLEAEVENPSGDEVLNYMEKVLKSLKCTFLHMQHHVSSLGGQQRLKGGVY